MHRVANPIAVRRFAVEGHPGREVVLTIGKPRKMGDWACSVSIEGIPKPIKVRVFGVDALQAMLLAADYARRALDATGLPLTWLDGEPGDVGIPFAVPTGYGLDFQRRLERYVARAYERFGTAVSSILINRDRRLAKRAWKAEIERLSPPGTLESAISQDLAHQPQDGPPRPKV